MSDPQEVQITFTLSPEEQQALVRTGTGLPDNLVNRLRFGLSESGRIHFRWGINDMQQLLDALFDELNTTRSRKLGRMLRTLYDRLSREWNDFLDERGLSEPPPGSLPLADLPPELRHALDDVLRTPEYAHFMDRLGAELVRSQEAYMTTPSPDLGGLTPEQLLRLIMTTPGDPSHPLRFDASISPDLVPDAPYIHNAQVFLRALDEEGGTKATAAGNLNRKFVRRMFDEIHVPEDYREIMTQLAKRFDEVDVWHLHLVRVLLEESSLIRKYKGQFVITKRGRHVAQPEHKPELLSELFTTIFFHINLSYLDRRPEWPEFQEGIPFSLWMMRNMPQEWTDPKTLAERVVIPQVMATSPTFYYDQEPAEIIESRLFRQLMRLGLVDYRYRNERHLTEFPNAIRKTDLFDHCIRFEW